MTERLKEGHQAHRMAPSTAISFAGLLFAMFLQTGVLAYYMGRSADRQDVHDQKIRDLEKEVKQIPVLQMQVQAAEKAADAAAREDRLKEYDDQARELREAERGYLAIHGKGKK